MDFNGSNGGDPGGLDGQVLIGDNSVLTKRFYFHSILEKGGLNHHNF